jgi:tRNA (guanine-N7-)-methyltransferase
VQTIYPQRARMTIGQRRAWERSWDRWGADVIDLPDGPLDTTRWFGRAAPEVDHLAVEVYQPGLAQLLLRIEQAQIANLRLLRGDAYSLLHDHIAVGSLDGVRIYFPDPWPKRRHHKRRLVNPEFVTLVASRLVPGGLLHLATDWEPYAQEMLAACTAEPALHNTAAEFATRPLWRPVTKFEQRARDDGRVVRDLLFTRR